MDDRGPQVAVFGQKLRINLMSGGGLRMILKIFFVPGPFSLRACSGQTFAWRRRAERHKQKKQQKQAHPKRYTICSNRSC